MKIKKKDVNEVKKILEKLLDLLEVEVKIEESLKDNSINFDLDSNDSGILIGYRGDNLRALQYIVNLLAKNKIEKDIYVVLDIANYKKDKDKRLKDFTQNIAEKVKKTKRSETLRPMNAYERRIAHMALSEVSGVVTESTGEEPNRRIVVKPE